MLAVGRNGGAGETFSKSVAFSPQRSLGPRSSSSSCSSASRSASPSTSASRTRRPGHSPASGSGSTTSSTPGTIRPFRGRWLLRFLILLPWAAPVALSTIGFLWIFDSQFSVLNWVLVHDVMPGGWDLYLYQPVNWLLGVIDHLPWVETGRIDKFNPPQWLGQPTLAKLAIILVQAWRILPFATVIFLAGLSSIPVEVEDAARMDGATGLRKFWYVSLPLQLPIALVAILFGIVFTATDMVVPYILTAGGPFNSTQVLTTWAFQTGINSSIPRSLMSVASHGCPVYE